jgi:hypothetical protein
MSRRKTLKSIENVIMAFGRTLTLFIVSLSQCEGIHYLHGDNPHLIGFELAAWYSEL